MRKTTIAIILLLSVTAVFAQRKPGYKSFTDASLVDVKPSEKDYRAYAIIGDTQKKKPATKKPATKPTTRKTKIDNAGDVYIGEFYSGGTTKENLIEVTYDFVDSVPLPYRGYKDTGYFPMQLAAIDHKFKCDTVYIHDTIRIKDTVNVPIYLVDVTDTLPATVMYKKDSKSDRVYTLKGFALVRGFKVMVQGKPQWADKPQIVGALDDRKRLIKNVIQVL